MSNQPELLFLDALASSAALYVTLRFWFKGSVFARKREILQAWSQMNGGWKMWVGEVALCPLCLSFWVAMGYLVVFLTPLAQDPGRVLLRALLYGLALGALFRPEDFNDGTGNESRDGSERSGTGDPERRAAAAGGTKAAEAGRGDGDHDGAGQDPPGPRLGGT